MKKDNKKFGNNKKLLVATIMALAFGFCGLNSAQAQEDFAYESSIDSAETTKGSISYTSKKKSLLNGQIKLKNTDTLTVSASDFAGVPTGFATSTPTLDSIKDDSVVYLEADHSKYSTLDSTLSPTKGTHTNSVVIDGTTYYYTPSEGSTDKNTSLINLVSTGSVAMIQGDEDNYVFYDGTNYWTYDKTKLPISAYTLTESASPTHWGITLPTWNETTQQYENKTYDLEMRDQGSGEQNLYYKWSVNSDGTGRKLVIGTEADHDLVVRANSGTGDTAVYYKRTVDANGNIIFGVGTSSDHDFVAHHDATSLTRITTGSGEDVTGDFFNLSGQTQGSAIYLSGKSLGNVVGDFVGNYASGSSSEAKGGAIYNNISSTISSIVGDFVGNYASSSDSNAFGGAIYNERSTISSIVGDFVGNYASTTTSSDSYANGGAICNSYSTISSIVGDFVGNYASASSSNAYGGAIHNTGTNATIGSITGDFIGNYASSTSSYAYGGAIRNDNNATISSIVGDFVGNYASSSSSEAKGGAISNTNSATISSIEGDFVGNYASSSGSSAYGGAIFISGGTISSIVGDFVGNYAYSSSNAYGGAIYNSSNSTISSIVGDFVGNYASSSSNARGGAIYNTSNSTISSIVGDFVGNYASASSSSNARGGAIFNNRSTISSIEGDFVGNYASSSGSYGAYGGAIYNNNAGAVIGNVTGNFTNNYAIGSGLGGAVYNNLAQITLTDSNFTGNAATTAGGAIYNSGTVNIIADGANVAFSGNKTGVTPTITDGKITGVTGGSLNDIHNQGTLNLQAKSGKSITFAGTITDAATPTGIMTIGGTYDVTTTDPDTGDEIVTPTAYSGTVNFNNAVTQNTINIATGTATFNSTVSATDSVSITNGTATFNDTLTSADMTISGGEVNISASDLNITNGVSNDATLNLGEGTLTSAVSGTGTTYIKGDVIANANISGNTVNLNSGTLTLNNGTFDNIVGLTATGGSLSTQNNAISATSLGNVVLTNNLNLAIDFNLSNLTSDSFNAIVNNNGGKFNVNNINLLGTTTRDEIKVHLGNTTKLGQDNVTSETIELPSIMTPIRTITGRVEDGWLMYSGSGSNSVDDFNPAVLASPVAAQAGVQATLNNTFNYAFNNADSFTKLPAAERMSIINANKYAINETKGIGSTDFNQNLNVGSAYKDNSAIWFRPYTTFEKIPLQNGPNVEAISYGTLVGYDSDFHHHKNGWESVASGYVGYNGAQLNYNGVDTSMNGGLLGVTETFYKKNFWTAVTATAGASVAESNTMYGHENSTNLMAGIGSKTGYNFEFKEGKFVIQPIWFMSYSMINTFNYTNAAGVRIDSKPLHTIQLNPSIRFIGNIKGWQPYAAVGMVWNLMDKSDVTANGVKLPEAHIKPYVQYGVGLQKQVGENFTGFAQAMIHNGGRNGISLTGGFRWTIGKSTKNKKIEKVQIKSKKVIADSKQEVKSKKTIIKSLPQNQKERIIKNSTITEKKLI